MFKLPFYKLIYWAHEAINIINKNITASPSTIEITDTVMYPACKIAGVTVSLKGAVEGVLFKGG